MIERKYAFLDKRKWKDTKIFQISEVKEMPPENTLSRVTGKPRKLYSLIVTGEYEGRIDDYAMNYLSYYDLKELIKEFSNDEKLWLGKMVLISTIPSKNPNFTDWVIKPSGL